MGTPLSNKAFDQDPFLVFTHLAPFEFGLFFFEAHVVAELSEEELSALPHGLLRLQHMGFYSGGLCRQLQCECRVAYAIAIAASGAAWDSGLRVVLGEGDDCDGQVGEERGYMLNPQSHFTHAIEIFLLGSVGIEANHRKEKENREGTVLITLQTLVILEILKYLYL